MKIIIFSAYVYTFAGHVPLAISQRGQRVERGEGEPQQLEQLEQQQQQQQQSSRANECREQEAQGIQHGGGGGSERENDFGIQPPGERFIVVGRSDQYVKKFHMTGTRLVLSIKNPPNERVNPFTWLEAAMSDIHAYLLSLANMGDHIGISISSDCFSHGPAGLSFRPIDTFNYDDLWTLVNNLTQSNDEFSINESFRVCVTFVDVPMGMGRKNLTIDTVALRSMVAIQNEDNLCLPRALAVG